MSVTHSKRYHEPGVKPVQQPYEVKDGVKKKEILLFVLRTVFPIIALAAGALLTLHLLKTGPQARPLPQKKNAILVETAAIHLAAHNTTVSAMGIVKPSQRLELKAQVTGEVISLDERLLPGGRFKAGDKILQLNQRDYNLVVRQQENAVEQAINDLDLESGNQLVAEKELELLGEQVTEKEKKLMLRQPQLNNLKTALQIEEAKLEQALLDLERTAVLAPFNGVVLSRDVSVGAWVSSSTTLTTILGTDNFWVEVSVPQDQLKWITLPKSPQQSGAHAKIYNPTAWGDGIYREGEVIQLLPALETQGRMARLLVEILDPLAEKAKNHSKPELLIDSYVRVVLEGKPLVSSLEIPREYVRDGENVWIFAADGTLDIRQVDIDFKNQENVLITSGVGEQEQLIISNLSSPVSGMLLKKAGKNKHRNKEQIGKMKLPIEEVAENE